MKYLNGVLNNLANRVFGETLEFAFIARVEEYGTALFIAVNIDKIPGKILHFIIFRGAIPSNFAIFTQSDKAARHTADLSTEGPATQGATNPSLHHPLDKVAMH